MDVVVGVVAMIAVVVKAMVGYSDCASSGDGGRGDGGGGCGCGGGGGGGGNNGCGSGGVRLVFLVVGGDDHFIFKKIKCMYNKK